MERLQHAQRKRNSKAQILSLRRLQHLKQLFDVPAEVLHDTIKDEILGEFHTNLFVQKERLVALKKIGEISDQEMSE